LYLPLPEDSFFDPLFAILRPPPRFFPRADFLFPHPLGNLSSLTLCLLVLVPMTGSRPVRSPHHFSPFRVFFPFPLFFLSLCSPSWCLNVSPNALQHLYPNSRSALCPPKFLFFTRVFFFSSPLFFFFEMMLHPTLFFFFFLGPHPPTCVVPACRCELDFLVRFFSFVFFSRTAPPLNVGRAAKRSKQGRVYKPPHLFFFPLWV